MTAVRLAPSIVTASFLESVLEGHSLLEEGKQFGTCKCGHKAMEVSFSRHIISDLKSRGAVLISVDPLKAAVREAFKLGLSLRHETLTDTKLNSTQEIVARMFRLYLVDGRGHSSSFDYAASAYGVLDVHQSEVMYLNSDGNVEFVCTCGAVFVGDWAWEYHRLTSLISAGIMYGSIDELFEIAGALSATARSLSSFFIDKRQGTEAIAAVDRLYKVIESAKLL